MAVTVKNFIYNGKFTNLYYVVKTILTNDNYCQRKYLAEMFDDWHYFRNIQLKLGNDLINTKEGNKSYFSISPDLYETYVDAMWSINKQPIRWTDIPKKVVPKDNVHYVHYDMEVESMDMKTAKQILNENGFLLEDTNTKSLVGKFWSAKKNGETLSKEDAEELLNAPDFDEVVNPKYKNYILSVCRKVLGIAKPEQPKEEKPKEVVKEEPKEEVEQKDYKKLGDLLYDTCSSYGAIEHIDLDGYEFDIIRSAKSLSKNLEEIKKFFQNFSEEDFSNIYVSSNTLYKVLEHLKTFKSIVDELIENNGKPVRAGDDKSSPYPSVSELKEYSSILTKVIDKFTENKDNISNKYVKNYTKKLKSLVGKFWSAKKGGAKLTKEEADELSDILFNYDMNSVINSVCGKYKDFIQNNFRKYSEGYVPPKKKYDDDPWAGVETMSDAQLKRWGHWH